MGRPVALAKDACGVQQPAKLQADVLAKPHHFPFSIFHFPFVIRGFNLEVQQIVV